MSLFGPTETLPPNPGTCYVCQELLEFVVYRPSGCQHKVHVQCSKGYVRSKLVQDIPVCCALCPALYDLEEFDVPGDLEGLRTQERIRQDVEQREETRRIIEREQIEAARNNRMNAIDRGIQEERELTATAQAIEQRNQRLRDNAESTRKRLRDENNTVPLLRRPNVATEMALWEIIAPYVEENGSAFVCVKMSTTRLSGRVSQMLTRSQPWSHFYGWNRITLADSFWIVHEFTKKDYTVNETTVRLGRRDSGEWGILTVKDSYELKNGETLKQEPMRSSDDTSYTTEAFAKFFDALKAAAAQMDPQTCKVAISASIPTGLFAFETDTNVVTKAIPLFKQLFRQFKHPE